MMKSNFLKVLAAGSMAATLLAGCSGGGAAGGASAGGEVGDTVKIGLNFELTGQVASYGQSERNGAQLAIEEFNARDDKPFTVEGVEIDDKGDPSESSMAATKLISEDGVAAIVGPATSGASIATYQICTDSKVPVVSPSATQVDATMNGDTAYEYAWRVCFEDTYQGKAIAIYAYDTLGDTKAVILNETSDYGRGLAKNFTEKFEELGGEVLATEEYDAGTTDFAGLLTKIKEKDFDVMYIAGYYTEAGQIIKQARDAGIDCDVVGADGFDSNILAEQAGAENLNNVYFTTSYSTASSNPELEAFVKAYKDKYSKDPDMFSALAYDATNLVLDQLEASGATGEALNEAIKTADFTGLTGSFTFNADTHTPEKSVLVVELENGEQKAATEVEVK